MAQRPWANWIRPYKKGQAALELAIFGSILIMLLGVLVNYGLRYNFQQKLMQQAFRKALGVAGTERTGTYILVKDQHIPQPANPFAVGSVVPVVSSASVVRDYRMYETANTKAGLSHTYFDIQGQTNQFYNAAFRDEYNVPESWLYDDYDEDESRYEYVYGFKGIGWWKLQGEAGEGDCLSEPVVTVDPDDGTTTTTCSDPSANIRIIDDCAGEIVDYSLVRSRCLKIDETGINRPWYCDQADALFAFNPDVSEPSMGLQQDYTQQNTMNNTLNKQENASNINTTDTLNWQVDTQRTIVFNDALDESGVSQGTVNVQNEEITSSVSQDKTSQWQTSF